MLGSQIVLIIPECVRGVGGLDPSPDFVKGAGGLDPS